MGRGVSGIDGGLRPGPQKAQKALMLIKVLALSLAVAALAQVPQPTDDYDWVERHIGVARDYVMPMGTPDQVAAYRATKDRFTDMAESYFSISRARTGPPPPQRETYVATVTAPAGNALRGTLFGGSLRSQLLELHHADSAAPLETLLLRLSIRRTRLTVAQCPAITIRLSELSGLSIVPPSPRQVIALHPVSHHVIVNTLEMHINTSRSDPGASLVQWALGTLDDLNKCITP